tara:strand:+ start:9902 stop:11602 length:1701 start_codon:yes stop_codon:yes gene_type:complete
MTYILGISSLISENPSAALIKDGKLIAAVEEERFNRIKHSQGYPFPEKSIQYCLDYAGITLKDIESIGVGGASPLEHLKKEFLLALKRPILFLNIGKWLKTFKKNKGHDFFKDKRITYYPHHLTHASSSFYVSGFNNANIISMDGKGETTSTFLAEGRNSKKIYKIKEYSSLNSIGALYESFTDYLGFKRHSHEGKVMGLASYGKPINKINQIIKFTKEGYSCETFSRYSAMLKNAYKKVFFGEKINSFEKLLIKNFGQKRKKDEPITKRHENIAATIQYIQEKVVLKLAKSMYEKNGITNFCLAGGSSLNCCSNGLLSEQDFVKNIFVQPASSDAGTSIGAAFLEWIKLSNKKSDFKMTNAYYGPEYTNQEILKELKKTNLKYKKYNKISKVTAKLISKGKIIGWFQGRMEMGPRALGNRSILADPTNKIIKDKVNLQVKHRENWRPFAPSILSEAAPEYFENSTEDPFMILSFRVKKEKRDKIPSVVHIDGTTRPQSVTKKDNPRYYELIKEFEKIKGVPIVLNTSFNDKEEPLVCSPKDAISCLKRTNLDYLAIGNYLVRNNH